MYNILLVDDEKMAREYLASYFPWESIGYHIVGQTDNGLEALRFISLNSVDVILCDIKMPVMDGIAVAKYLYENKSPIKIVFFSAYRDISYIQKAFQYGVKNFIPKPTKYEEIKQILTQLALEMEEEAKMTVADSTFDNQDEMLAYINENLATASLDSVAAHFEMNPNYLSACFKTRTGENFSQYLARQKMTNALTWLTKGIKTSEISSRLGYSTNRAFCRAFRNYYNVDIKDYQEIKDSNNGD